MIFRILAQVGGKGCQTMHIKNHAMQSRGCGGRLINTTLFMDGFSNKNHRLNILFELYGNTYALKLM